MTLHFLSLSWAATSPAMANHLWQSTLFAAVVAMLSVALRKNQAKIRYRLWMAASLKFLIPFSLLISLGDHLSGKHYAMNWQGSWLAAMRAVGQPFTLYVTTEAHPATSPSLLSLLAAAVWLCGTVAVLSLWSSRWRRVHAAKLKATAMSQGREFQALRRTEQATEVRRPMAILISRDTLEPGIFGVVRPVLLWPEAISEQLSDEHLQAIFAHEVAHVRRRDNLAATIHMATEAIFWFHPLIWWLGARMVEERERACDEAVLAQGHSPERYAESILKTCEYCVASPLACVSGVTGADLKKRVVRIMTPQIVEKLTTARKLLLASVGVTALVAPVLFGLFNTPRGMAQGPIYHVGGDVSAPELTYSVAPEFSEEAKRAKYQGVCVVRLVVDAQGKPQHIQIVRHLKMGLDEKAIEAVKQYRFAPAKFQDRPVAVEVNIEINFRRY